MNIAGVSVNEKNAPSKEQILEAALKGVQYYRLPKAKAIKLINLEIKASGLFKSTVKRTKKSNRSY